MMGEQMDIRDFLGEISQSSKLFTSMEHKARVGEILKHFHRGGAHPRSLRRCAASKPLTSHSSRIRPRPQSIVSRLRAAPPSAKEGEGGMSNFTDKIVARLAEIERQIISAGTKERRALQKERTDLEDKLRRAAPTTNQGDR